MIVGKYIPENARQVRYIHPQYEQDEDGNEYIWNEEEMTDVNDLINTVNKTKIPIYFRRRHSNYARDDTRRWNQHINSMNIMNKTNGDDFINVRMRKVGRRVLVDYDKEYWDKIISSGKKIKRGMDIVSTIIRRHPVGIQNQTAAERYAETHEGIQEMMDSFVDSHDEDNEWGYDEER